jgi:hypothetical protein
MKRKKTDTVQLSKIRMREDLRSKLAEAAERREVTLNGEIVARLEQSFTREANRESEKLQVEKDAEVLNLLVGRNTAAADILRKIVFEMQSNPKWDGNKAQRRQMADCVHAYIYPPEIFGED